MSPFFIIFAPFLKLVGHSLAASLGFSGIAMIAILPVTIVKQLTSFSLITDGKMRFFEMIEATILFLDAALLVFVIIIYSIYFIVEQWRALRKLLNAQA